MNLRSKWKISKISMFVLLALDFLIAVISPVISIKYGNPELAGILLFILMNFLIYLTLLVMGICMFYNLELAKTEKRTKKQELVIRQNFWGRIILLIIAGFVSWIYSIIYPSSDWFLVMFILFALSVVIGSWFGRTIIKK